MRYVLHIGLPKCGSTSLQGFLCLNAARLQSEGVTYPCGEGLPHPRQHSWILQAVDEPEGPLTHLLEVCRRTGVAVLSGESMTNMSPSQVARLSDRLASEGGATEVRVILYLRNLADLVLALCAEWVKLTGRAYEETIAHQTWSIRSVIEGWEAAFGPDSVDVRLLEAADPSLEADFCRAAGLPWLEDYQAPPRMNQTADPLSAQLLRLLEIEWGRDRGHRALLQTTRKLPRLENHYLRKVSDVIARVDLGHPKLARFANELTAIRWRDEDAGPALVEYLDELIAGLLQVRQLALAAEPTDSAAPGVSRRPRPRRSPGPAGSIPGGPSRSP